MNGRQALQAAIAEKLPKRYRVVEPIKLAALEPKSPVVMVIRTNLAPAPNAQGSYVADYEIWLIEPKTLEPEDDLDDALDDLVLALDSYDFVAWTDAERSTYNDQPAYRITAKTIEKKEIS